MITLIRALIALTRPFSTRFSHCELNGMLIGAIVGMIFSAIWMAAKAFTPVAYPLWVYIALVLAVFCWITLLVLLCGPLKYSLGAVAMPLLVNAVLTSVLTVYLCNVAGTAPVFFMIGILVGYVVGRLLCRFCRVPARNTREG